MNQSHHGKFISGGQPPASGIPTISIFACELMKKPPDRRITHSLPTHGRLGTGVLARDVELLVLILVQPECTGPWGQIATSVDLKAIAVSTAPERNTDLAGRSRPSRNPLMPGFDVTSCIAFFPFSSRTQPIRAEDEQLSGAATARASAGKLLLNGPRGLRGSTPD